MFKIFGKKKKYTEVIPCVEGILKSLKDVNDKAFSSGAIGRGIAVKPTASKIVAPIDGTVSMIFPTNHALGLSTDDGLEFLIHIGLDTVKLKGEGFRIMVSEGQKVKKGDLLAEVDFNMLAERGYGTDTLLILTTDEETADFEELIPYGSTVSGKSSVIFKCSLK